MSAADRPEPSSRRYTAVAVTLHWLIALLVISMVPMGWWMVRAIEAPDSQQLAYQVFQIHKSIGFAILALTVFRLIWRLTHPAPALPSGMKGWEAFAAHATHAAFYLLLLAIPLTGWIYVSSGWSVGYDRPLSVATSWFGLFPVPHLPGLEGQRGVAFGAMGAHGLLAWGGVVLVALHVGAALKHQLIDRDGVLSHMIPVLKGAAHDEDAQPKPAKAFAGPLATGAGLAAMVVLGALGWALSQPAPLAAAAPQEDGAVSAAVDAVDRTPGAARVWTIDRSASSIAFGGTHAGKPFTGRFEDWDGQVWFDPQDLAGSKALIAIRTISARTGDATQEGSLKGGEWFNAARFPEARFEAATFRALGGDRYEAQGFLTIKGKATPVTLPFTYRVTGDRATVEGEIELDRTVLDLGMFSDAAGDWVSRTITVTIKVQAASAASQGQPQRQ